MRWVRAKWRQSRSVSNFNQWFHYLPRYREHPPFRESAWLGVATHLTYGVTLCPSVWPLRHRSGIAEIGAAPVDLRHGRGLQDCKVERRLPDDGGGRHECRTAREKANRKEVRWYGHALIANSVTAMPKADRRKVQPRMNADERRWTERNDEPAAYSVVRDRARARRSGTLHLRSSAVEISCFPGPIRDPGAKFDRPPPDLTPPTCNR